MIGWNTPWTRSAIPFGLLLLAALQAAGQTPLGPGFTYQGLLNQNGQPVTGSVSMRFSLWDAAGAGSPPNGGNQVGGTQQLTNVIITDGVFTVTLNDSNQFGSTAFNGPARFLQIEICTDSNCVSRTTLSPRQPLTVAPYARFAAAPWTQPTAGGNIIAYNLGNVGINTSNPLNRLHVVAGSSGDGIRLTGGVGTDPGLLFFNGTTPGGGLGLAVSAANWSLDAGAGDLVLRSNTGNKLLLQSGFSGSGLAIASGNNIGVGTTTPVEKLTVAGDIGLGQNSADYHALRIGGGNSNGFLYGSFPHFGDGIHIGYNFYADAGGNSIIPNTGGQTSRISMGFGSIALATGGVNAQPVDRLFVTTAGRVGIGTAAPAAPLEVVSTSAATGALQIDAPQTDLISEELNQMLRLNSTFGNGAAGIRFTAASRSRRGIVIWDDRMHLWNDLSLGFALLDDDGGWSSLSDRRMKTEITPAAGLLDKTLALRPVEFYMKNQDRAIAPDKCLGLISQEVQSLFPSLVHEDRDGLLTLSYDRIGVVAIGAIQEQQALIEEQQKTIEVQQARIARLEAQAAADHATLLRVTAQLQDLGPASGR